MSDIRDYRTTYETRSTTGFRALAYKKTAICLLPERRAINSGKCAIEVEGGKVPTKDWFGNLQILTSGGFQ